LPQKDKIAVTTAIRAFRKGAAAVSLEIQAFRIHLDGLAAHFFRKKLAEESERGVLVQRAQWVREQVEAKKMSLLLEKEDIEWKWSPLFHAFRKLPDLPRRYRGRPFVHTAEELQHIIRWTLEEFLPSFEAAPVPTAVLPLKRIS
jgi:hypothetical protein